MEDEKDVKHDSAYIAGRTQGPFGSDDTDVDRPVEDNKNQYEQENSANGTDSQQVRGGQDGRNERAIGSTDMDSKNGILRMGDTSNSTLEVTEEGMNAAVADGKKTNTATVDVTTSGPDDYGSADQVSTPKAQEAAKKQDDSEKTDKNDKDQQEREKDVAETGTDLNNQPAY
ncbi:hypothetical protein [Spirosoma endophyticum]|uniref:Uncharacterized protein n=1 Tax=Spirosoma endophyticum TaxID=662367 RepID=A0A1I1LVA5_9BACT|nr:hypothetical protein [Spirosoma endophyticum]SFC74243.1 hypothetical protein SAMN05216167_102285 [Spirosoma endophyticum]